MSALAPDVRAESVTSEDGRYRFRLERIWDTARPHLVWCMLHPGLDAVDWDTRSLTRIQHFARQWGWGGIVAVNLFALRVSDAFLLKQHCGPVGARNDDHIVAAARDARAKAVIAAWGNGGRWFGRGDEVRVLLADNGIPLWRLGGPLTRFGQPVSPLVMPYTGLPVPWPPPTMENADA